jgi:Holliday junction DNA helicase RuvA
VIASLTGKVQAKAAQSIVLDVSGVGYLVSVLVALLAAAEVGQSLTVHTALIVREDAFALFGFASAEQLSLFDLLRSVTGVGPKLALSILSSLAPEQIASAVANEDADAFQKVSGVGAKTAKLIAVTLAGKLKVTPGAHDDIEQSILESLKGLGWHEKSAAAAIKTARTANPNADVATIVRAALIELGKS